MHVDIHVFGSTHVYQSYIYQYRTDIRVESGDGRLEPGLEKFGSRVRG